MKIGTKEHLATAMIVSTVCIVAAAIGVAYAQVTRAGLQRERAETIAYELTELRLLTMEYVWQRQDRPRAQWQEVSDDLERLIDGAPFPGREAAEIILRLRDRARDATALFAEISAMPQTGAGASPQDGANRRFEAQSATRLFTQQQESLDDALRLASLATQRIDAAQQRVMMVILTGLALIAVMKGGASWLIHRAILAPIAKLQQATSEIAAGNWRVDMGSHGDDEIGELARNFDSMIRTLEGAFAEGERQNLHLAALNAELESFSYSVSHDLRAPLRSIDGFSQVLLEDHNDRLDDEGRDAIARIRSASQRMGGLIDDLLRLSQVTRAPLALEPVDLGAMARELAASLGESERRRVAWTIDEDMVMDADKALIRIALLNLMHNAVKFTGREDQPTVHIGMMQRDGAAVFFVADNGVGFDMAHATHLFGAFRRLHSFAEFPGTGIGLAIVERIVRRHNGRIWAEARPHEGATFFFTLPGSGAAIYG